MNSRGQNIFTCQILAHMDEIKTIYPHIPAASNKASSLYSLFSVKNWIIEVKMMSKIYVSAHLDDIKEISPQSPGVEK